MPSAPNKRPPGHAAGWASLPSRAILPLRAFLGFTFLYAGWQKFTDPQFFDPTAGGYIGRQLEGYAQTSPLSWLLTGVAIPHATFIGGLIAFSELLLGLATLLGLLSRLAASGGCLISTLLWLTATWSVKPYFLGSDTIYAMAWVTLAIYGPTDYSLDHWLERQPQHDHATLAAALLRTKRQPQRPGQRRQRTTAADLASAELQGPADIKRRALLRQLLAGGAVLATGVLTTLLARAVESAGSLFSSEDAGSSGSSPPTSTPAPGTTAGAIGNTSQLPVNGTLTFTLSNGDPGVVVRLSATQYVAYDATCTHAGCTVQYDPSSKDFLCPCHGASFDPAHNGAVLGGPTSQPLASVPVHVDSSGNIFVNG